MRTTRTDTAAAARAAMNEDDLRRALVEMEASPEYVAENSARADWWRRFKIADARGEMDDAFYAYEQAASHRRRMTEMTAPIYDLAAQVQA